MRKLQGFFANDKTAQFQLNGFGLFFVDIQMNKQKFNTMDNVCLNLSNKGVNSIILLKFCKEMHYFHDKFTQLEIFLYDC